MGIFSSLNRGTPHVPLADSGAAQTLLTGAVGCRRRSSSGKSINHRLYSEKYFHCSESTVRRLLMRLPTRNVG